MDRAFLAGELVYLRPLERADLTERYLSWLNDPEVNRYLETGLFPQTKDALEGFYESVTKSRDHVILAIMDSTDNVHIGNVKLGPISWIHRKATLGIMLGEKRFWGRGMGQEAIGLVLDYAFRRLNLERVELGVIAEHVTAVGCYKKLGFRVEGRLRSAAFHEGAYKDTLWMGILRCEYPGKLSRPANHEVGV